MEEERFQAFKIHPTRPSSFLKPTVTPRASERLCLTLITTSRVLLLPLLNVEPREDLTGAYIVAPNIYHKTLKTTGNADSRSLVVSTTRSLPVLFDRSSLLRTMPGQLHRLAMDHVPNNSHTAPPGNHHPRYQELLEPLPTFTVRFLRFSIKLKK